MEPEDDLESQAAAGDWVSELSDEDLGLLFLYVIDLELDQPLN